MNRILLETQEPKCEESESSDPDSYCQWFVNLTNTNNLRYIECREVAESQHKLQKYFGIKYTSY